jgi:hypothetical protein
MPIRSLPHWLLTTLLLAACRHPVSDTNTKRVGPAASAVPARVDVAVSASSVAASAPTASAPSESEGRAACPQYEQGMAKGRTLTKAGRYQEAIQAFDRAVRARPVDARARAERGFAYLTSGATERSISDFDDARVLTQDRGLLSQIYLNLATASQKLNAPEAERLALVLALRRGSREARARLGERSICPAVWHAQLGKVGPIARNFMDMVEPRPVVGCDYHAEKVHTEAQARKYVCHGCAPGGEDDGDQCSGPGPWTIDSGYMNFHPFQFFIAPLPGGQFFFSDREDTPYHLEAGHLVTGSYHDEFPLRIRSGSGLIGGRFSSPADADAEINEHLRWSDEDDKNSICDLRPDGVELEDFRGTPTLPGMAPSEHSAYSLRTRHERFTLAVYDGSVSFTIEADRARVRGEGCDAEIPLPADP